MNATRLQRTVQALDQDRSSLDALFSAAKERGGRAFAGLATPDSWGQTFKVGAIPMYHLLAAARVPTVGYLSHTMALTSGVMLGFDERNPAHYRLFDVRTFIVPAGTKYPVPVFLKPGAIFGRFQIFDTPANGYFDLVDVPAAVPVTRDDFLDTNLRWLKTVGPSTRQHLRLDLPGSAPVALSPAAVAAQSPGEILNAKQTGEVYQAEFLATRSAWALFKMTWHPELEGVDRWPTARDCHALPRLRRSARARGSSHHRLPLRSPETGSSGWRSGAFWPYCVMALAERRILPAD